MEKNFSLASTNFIGSANGLINEITTLKFDPFQELVWSANIKVFF